VPPSPRPWTVNSNQLEDSRERKHDPPRPAAHPVSEVPGTDRIRGRSQAELADAMTWLAWYAPGTFTAVMDYTDTINGEPIPDRI
jgi:hypothetical protein